MKKILVIALAAILVVSAVCVLAACGKEETVTGSVDYTAWSTHYGVKVDVTVKGGVIKAVKLYSDEETNWVRTSANQGNWTRHDETEAAYDSWIAQNIVGKNVDTVLGWEVTVNATTQTVGDGVPHIAQSTQSSARIIAAVQNALGNLSK